VTLLLLADILMWLAGVDGVEGIDGIK